MKPRVEICWVVLRNCRNKDFENLKIAGTKNYANSEIYTNSEIFPENFAISVAGANSVVLHTCPDFQKFLMFLNDQF
jgi:hypothetical protein